jgi:hypothetical protein
MDNLQRHHDIQKAIQLLLDFREGKEIDPMQWNDALVNACIHAQQLMDENAALRAKKEKKKRDRQGVPYLRVL